MKYFASFSNGNTYLNGAYEYTSKTVAIRDIIRSSKANSWDRMDWIVRDEDGFVVAAGYTYHGRNHNTPEYIGERF